ncbi:importin-5-like [Rhopalosiphum padi]|uniref:importin-5-like n=1 Tax=Rhopalosiphum padi TaxID=40932 RepID=UPI00298DB35C|nr:importin-5-like [Rhopalosiphum padi]
MKSFYIQKHLVISGIRLPATIYANRCLIIDNKVCSAITITETETVIANSIKAENDNMGDFHQILTSLLSADNHVRQTAEETYQALPLGKKVSYLFNVVQNQAGNIDEKQMAAVMLHRLMANEFMDFYSHLSPENQKQFKNNLLLTVNNEKNDIIRRRMCDVASEVARNQLDDEGNNNWPEFLNFLFQCANFPSNDMKDSALRIFINVPGVFGNQQSNYLVVIKQMFQQSLNVPDSNIQVQTVKAICAFILHHDKLQEIQEQLTDLLPNMMRIINESLIAEEDDSLIKLLVNLAGNAPIFLKSQLSDIVEMCLRYLGNKEASQSYRQMCLEVIVTLTETAPTMMRKKSSKYIIQLTGQVLELMANVEDDDDWSTQDDPDEIDQESMSVIAEYALDRLACRLGGKIMLSHIISNVSSMLDNPSWKDRYAALMAISAMGGGFHKEMLHILPEILDRILTLLKDSHPRVRYSMCNVIVQMGADFSPKFQKKFHEKIVPAILLLLEDNLNPRVQAHAGAALLNFSKDCPKKILLSYMDLIMVKLENILQARIADLVKGGGRLIVLEQMVTTIACVANTCEGDFVKFYDHLMPFLKEIIRNAVAPELKLLRGKTIECISLIGLAVGQEKFLADASVIMDLMLATHNKYEKLSEYDPQTSYLIISSWTRICKVMGQQFEQYLPLVIGPVMAAASLKPEVVYLNNDDKRNMTDKSEWQFVPLWKQQNFGIKTSSLEDKASACEMLVCYARELKIGFAPYAEDVVKLMVPLLKFYFHDNVRIAAAQSMPNLLKCAEIRGPEYLQHMWGYILPELLQAFIKFEPDPDVSAEMYDALRKCIELLGTGCLSDKWIKDILYTLETNLNSHFEREAQHFKRRKDDDYDEVEEERLALEDCDDVYSFTKLTEILHVFFVTFKTDFFQYFDLIVHQFAKLLDSDKSAFDHKWGLCIFNDLIEFCGPGCAKYQEYFLRPMIEYVKDINSDVRLAAIYGCGVLGMCGGPSFASVCAEIMPFLLQVINNSEARSAENMRATENAVSAIAKILEYNNSAVNVNEILPLWLCNLPICEDTDEAPFVYGYLCKLIENQHPLVLGQNNSNIPSLIRIIAEAFLQDAIDRSHIVAQRMIMIVNGIQANQEVFNACLAVLNPEHMKMLQSLLMTNN